MKWHLRAQRNLCAQSIDVFPHVRTVDGAIGAVTRFEVREVEPGTMLPDAPIRLTDEQAQELIDDLYRCGFRPSDARGTAGQLEAMKAHLEDMRRSYDVLLQSAQVRVDRAARR